MKLLHLDSSIMGANSVSRQLSASLVAQIRKDKPGIDVTYVDLALDTIPHLSGALFAAQAAAASDRTAEQQRDVDISIKTMEDFLAADIIVIGAPMYNFSVSSQLKAWIDRIAVAGKTFAYTAEGPKGLVGGKHVIIVSSRGGIYSEGSPAASVDHQETYLRAVFGFLGITDVNYIRAEGVAMGPEHREKAIAQALDSIRHCKEKAAA